MAEPRGGSSDGIGCFGLLAILFIALKLCKVIDWSWWWVTVPIWAPISAAFLLASALGVFAIVRDRR